MLDAFLDTLPAIQRTRARAALERQVRLNGAEFLTRAAIVERRVNEGAAITSNSFGRVLMASNGAFLDARNITAFGLDYAAFLQSR